MLKVLPRIPEHKGRAREAKRMLKKVRGAAGDVRDIDVQLELIGTVAPEDAAAPLRRGAAKLRKMLESDREEFAQRLVKMLRRQQSKLALTLESFLELMEPVEGLSVSSTELTSLAERWFRSSLPAEPKGGTDDPEYLHSIRKVAKLARYIAENAPKKAKQPRKLAENFERLQQSGGEWHDWLVLEEIAGDRLGASSPLTKALARRSDISLATYHRHLREMSG